MVTAIVLINAKHELINETAEALAEMNEISEVYSVTGEYDIIAILRTHTNEEIAQLVTDRILKLEGIKDTETFIAFKTYSRHDLDRMFSIGFEEE